MPEQRTLDDRVRRLEEDRDAMFDVLLDIQARVTAQGNTLGRNDSVLNGHSAILAEHSSTLAEHSATLAEHGATLADHGAMLTEILRRLPEPA